MPSNVAFQNVCLHESRFEISLLGRVWQVIYNWLFRLSEVDS